VGSLFGATLYDAIVLAPNLRGGPKTLEHGRLFLTRSNPGNLFRTLAPLSQVLLLLAIVVDWSRPGSRWPLIGSLVALAITDVITFTYHYPRNRLFFTAPLDVPPDRLDKAAREWAAMNFVRVALVLGAWLGAWWALLNLAGEGHLWPIA
jgi:uncharacterized membrane protein